MDEAQEIDVEQIMERIRESIKRRRGLAESPDAEGHTSPFEDGQAMLDFTLLSVLLTDQGRKRGNQRVHL